MSYRTLEPWPALEVGRPDTNWFQGKQRDFIREARRTYIYTGHEGTLNEAGEAGFPSSDEFHLGIGVHGHHIISLWWLDSRLSMVLTVQPFI